MSKEDTTKQISNTIKELQILFSTDKKGFEFVKGVLILFDTLRVQIEDLPKPSKTNPVNYSEIEGVILNAIISDKAPVDVLVVRRCLIRCIKVLYENNPSLIGKTNGKLIKILQSINYTIPKQSFIIFCLSKMYDINFSSMPKFSTIKTLLWRIWKMNDETTIESIFVLINSYLKNHPKISLDFNETFEFLIEGILLNNKKIGLQISECLKTISYKIELKDAGSKYFEKVSNFCIQRMEEEIEHEILNNYSISYGEMISNITPKNEQEEEEMKKMKNLKFKIFNFTTSLFSLTSLFFKANSNLFRESISISVIHFLKKFEQNIIELNLDLTISHLFGLLSNPKIYSSNNIVGSLGSSLSGVGVGVGNGGVGVGNTLSGTLNDNSILHMEHLIGNIIRFGISNKFNENGKLNLISILCSMINIHFNNEYSLNCILKEISNLIKELNEIIILKKDIILESILNCLKHKNESIQFSATLTIRCLSESLPFQTSNLISALLGLVQIDYAELTMELQMNKDKHYIHEKYSKTLFGHSIALSSLISTSLEIEYSESNNLNSACLDTAILILSSTNSLKNIESYPFIIMKKLESSFILISSLMSLSEDWIKLHIEKIFDSWDKIFNSKLFLNLNYFNYRIHSSCLLSIHQFLKKCKDIQSKNEDYLNIILKYLSKIIKILETLPNDYIPKSKEETFSINLLKLNLFKIFELLPNNLINKHIFNFITKLGFAQSDGSISGIKTSLLDKFDDENNNEIKLNQYFKSSKFEFIPFDILKNTNNFIFNNIKSVSIRCVDHSILMLGNIFPNHKLNSKIQIIDQLIIQLKSISNKEENLLIFTNVSACVNIILKILKENKLKIEKEDEIYLMNIHAILNACLGHSNSKIRKCSSESMGYLSILLGNVILEDLIKRSNEKLINGSGPIRIGYALALGKVNSSLSMKSQILLPSTVSLLQTFCRSNLIELQSASLESLWLISESIGVSFTPYIESITQLLSMLIFSIKSSDKHILLLSAKNLHSFLGVFGNDILKKKYLVKLFEFFLNDFLNSSNYLINIESINLIERSIIISPNLIKINQILPHLKLFLKNKKLRQSTIDCLNVISKTNQSLILNNFNLNLLFDYLNESKKEKEISSFKELISFQIKLKIIPINYLITLFKLILKEKKENYNFKTKLFLLEVLNLFLNIYKNELLDNHYLNEIIYILNFTISIESILIQIKSINIFKQILILYGEKKDENDELILNDFTIHFISALQKLIEKSKVSSSYLLFISICDFISIFFPSLLLLNQEKTLIRISKLFFNFFPIDILNINSKSSSILNNFGDISTSILKIEILKTYSILITSSIKNENLVLLNILQPLIEPLKYHFFNFLKDDLKLKITRRDVSILNSINSDWIMKQEFNDMFYFYNDGTQNEIFNYFKSSFHFILESLSLISLHQNENENILIIGLSLFQLYNSKEKDILNSCLNSINLILNSTSFCESITSPSICFEILLCLIKLPSNLNFEYLIESILKNIKFKDSKISEFHIVNSIIEIILNSLKFNFPLLFDNTLQNQWIINDIKNENVIINNLNLLKLLFEKFKLTKSNYSNISFILIKMIEYFNNENISKNIIDVLLLLLNSMKLNLDLNSNLNLLDILINHILINRIQNQKIQSSFEIEILFILLSFHFNLNENDIEIHQYSILILTNNLNIEFNELNLYLILKGIQNGIVFLARLIFYKRQGYSNLSIHYLGQICPFLYQFLIQISKNNQMISKHLINSICCGINILLASFSLIEQKNISNFLSLMIPILLILFRFSSNNNIVILNKLCQQCFTRVATSSPNQFRNEIQKLPQNIVLEIQDIFKSSQN
eukprot:gene8859-808_t